jgi:hypothetical protein
MPLVYTSDSLDPPLSLTRQQVLRLLEHLPNRPGQFLNRHPLIGVLEWRFDEAAGLWIYVDIKQRRVYDMTEDELADVYGVRPLVTALNRLGTLLECPNEPLRVRQASAIPVAHFTPGREMFSNPHDAAAYDMACTLIRQLADEGMVDGMNLALYVDQNCLDLNALLSYGNSAGDLHIEDVLSVSDLIDSYSTAQEDVNALDQYHYTDGEAKAWDNSLIRPSRREQLAIAAARKARRLERLKDDWKTRTFSLVATDSMKRGTAAQVDAAIAAEVGASSHSKHCLS